MSAEIFLEQLGYLFYAVRPNKTSFQTLVEVPDYFIEIVLPVTLLIILEQCLLLYQKKPTFRVNDAVASMSQGIFQELIKMVLRGVQLTGYIYVYENWRLVTLPWDSPWTWWLCFLGVDFAYYWLHRACHEINILWATHQVHHSSEDYNLTSALRQSLMQTYSVWMFNLPLALAIPPSVFFVHTQLNLIYQFWIHTEVIRSLGPLEYVLNTASHHRVHHGRNRYCIDKNYAGVLIIWDRMFGTFQAEDEEVVYGLTQPVNSFESLYIQFYYYLHIWRTFWETRGLKNKLSVIFKGPGWSPGTPWHGYLEDIPEVKAPVEKYDPPLPLWCKIYVLHHFLLLLPIHVEIATNRQLSNQQEILPWIILLGSVAYGIFSMSTLGILLEGRFYAPGIEIIRCLLYFAMDCFFLPYTRLYTTVSAYKNWILLFLRSTFVISALFWTQYCIRSISVKMYTNKEKKEE